MKPSTKKGLHRRRDVEQKHTGMFETEIENTNSLSTELSTKQDRTVEAYRLVTDVRLNIGERSVLEPIRPYRGLVPRL